MTKASLRQLKGQAVFEAYVNIRDMPRVDDKTKKALESSKNNKDRLSKGITDKN